MATRPVRIDTELIEQAKIAAKTSFRTVAKQIEYWANIGIIALENPELTISDIEAMLVAREKAKA